METQCRRAAALCLGATLIASLAVSIDFALLQGRTTSFLCSYLLGTLYSLLGILALPSWSGDELSLFFALALPVAVSAAFPFVEGVVVEQLMRRTASRKPLLSAFIQNVVVPLFRGDAQQAFISFASPLLFETFLAPLPQAHAAPAAGSMPPSQRALERFSSLVLYLCVALAVLASRAMLWKPSPVVRRMLHVAQLVAPGFYYIYLGLIAHGARFHLALPAVLLCYPLAAACIGVLCTDGVALAVRRVQGQLPVLSAHPSLESAKLLVLQYSLSCAATLWAIAAGRSVADRIVAFSVSRLASQQRRGAASLVATAVNIIASKVLADGAGGAGGLFRAVWSVFRTLRAAVDGLRWGPDLWARANALLATYQQQYQQQHLGGGSGDVGAHVSVPDPAGADAGTAPVPWFLSPRGGVYTLVYLSPLLLLLCVICANYAMAIAGLWRLLGTFNVKWSLPTLGAVKKVRVFRAGAEEGDDAAASRSAAAVSELLNLMRNPAELLAPPPAQAGGAPGAQGSDQRLWFERVAAVLQRLRVLEEAQAYDISAEEWRVELRLDFPVQPGERSAEIPPFTVVLAALYNSVQGLAGVWARLLGDPYAFPVAALRSRTAYIPSAAEYARRRAQEARGRDRAAAQAAAEAAAEEARQAGTDPTVSAELARLKYVGPSDGPSSPAGDGTGTFPLEGAGGAGTEGQESAGTEGQRTPRDRAPDSGAGSAVGSVEGEGGVGAGGSPEGPSRSFAAPAGEGVNGGSSTGDAPAQTNSPGDVNHTPPRQQQQELRRRVGGGPAAPPPPPSHTPEDSAGTPSRQVPAALSPVRAPLLSSSSPWRGAAAFLSSLLSRCSSCGQRRASGAPPTLASTASCDPSVPVPRTETLSLVFDCVVSGRVVRPYLNAARVLLWGAREAAGSGKLHEAAKMLSPLGFLRALESSGHLAGYAAYLEAELGGSAADTGPEGEEEEEDDEEEGTGGGLFSPLRADPPHDTYHSGSLIPFTAIPWSFLRVRGNIQVPLVRWERGRLIVDPGSPLSLLGRSGGGSVGGLALRDDILGAFTGVLSLVPIERVRDACGALDGVLAEAEEEEEREGGPLLPLLGEERAGVAALRGAVTEYKDRLWALHDTLARDSNLLNPSSSAPRHSRGQGSAFTSGGGSVPGGSGVFGSLGFDNGADVTGEDIVEGQRANEQRERRLQQRGAGGGGAPPAGSSTPSTPAGGPGTPGGGAAPPSDQYTSHSALQQIGEAVACLSRVQVAVRALAHTQALQRQRWDLRGQRDVAHGAALRASAAGRLGAARGVLRIHCAALVSSANGLLTVVMKAAIFTALEALRTSILPGGSGGSRRLRRAQQALHQFATGPAAGIIPMLPGQERRLQGFANALGSVSPLQLAVFGIGAGSLLQQLYNARREAQTGPGAVGGVEGLGGGLGVVPPAAGVGVGARQLSAGVPAAAALLTAAVSALGGGHWEVGQQQQDPQGAGGAVTREGGWGTRGGLPSGDGGPATETAPTAAVTASGEGGMVLRLQVEEAQSPEDLVDGGRGPAPWSRYDLSGLPPPVASALSELRKMLKVMGQPFRAPGALDQWAESSLEDGPAAAAAAEAAEERELELGRRSAHLRIKLLSNASLAPLVMAADPDAQTPHASDAPQQQQQQQQSLHERKIAHVIALLRQAALEKSEASLGPLLLALAAVATPGAPEGTTGGGRNAPPPHSTGSPSNGPSMGELVRGAAGLRRSPASGSSTAAAAAVEPALPWRIETGYRLTLLSGGAPDSGDNRGAVGEALKEHMRQELALKLTQKREEVMAAAARINELAEGLGDPSLAALPPWFLQINVPIVPVTACPDGSGPIPATAVAPESLPALLPGVPGAGGALPDPCALDTTLLQFERLLDSVGPDLLPPPEPSPLPHIYDVALAHERRVTDLLDDKGVPKVWGSRVAYTGLVPSRRAPVPDAGDTDPTGDPGVPVPPAAPSGRTVLHVSPYAPADRAILATAYRAAHAFAALIAVRDAVLGAVRAADVALEGSSAPDAPLPIRGTTRRGGAAAPATAAIPLGRAGFTKAGLIGTFGAPSSYSSSSRQQQGVLQMVQQTDAEKFGMRASDRPVLRVTGNTSHTAAVQHPNGAAATVYRPDGVLGLAMSLVASGDPAAPYALPLPVTAAFLFFLRGRLWDCLGVCVEGAVTSAEAGLRATLQALEGQQQAAAAVVSGGAGAPPPGAGSTASAASLPDPAAIGAALKRTAERVAIATEALGVRMPPLAPAPQSSPASRRPGETHFSPLADDRVTCIVPAKFLRLRAAARPGGGAGAAITVSQRQGEQGEGGDEADDAMQLYRVLRFSPWVTALSGGPNSGGSVSAGCVMMRAPVAVYTHCQEWFTPDQMSAGAAAAGSGARRASLGGSGAGCNWVGRLLAVKEQVADLRASL